jgi:hypothetical protein
MMTEAATIEFQDTSSYEEALAIVRYDEDHVAVCLSLKSDGDIEVTTTKQDVRRLLEALRRALA